MEVDVHGAKILFEFEVFGVEIRISQTLVVTWGIMIVLTLLCIWMTHNMKLHNISKKQAVAEKIVLTAENFVRTNMGEKWMRFVPFVGTIFALSLSSSLSSLLGLFAPTADLATELAWAIVVFVLITYYKIKTNRLSGYLKGFCEPIFVMAPFNVLSEAFTPVSMSFRHFGNIVSGLVISSLIYAALGAANRALFGIIPGAIGKLLGSIPFLEVGIPSVFSLYFDWFGSFMQAFIFCMLTMIFISSAAEED